MGQSKDLLLVQNRCEWTVTGIRRVWVLTSEVGKRSAGRFSISWTELWLNLIFRVPPCCQCVMRFGGYGNSARFVAAQTEFSELGRHAHCATFNNSVKSTKKDSPRGADAPCIYYVHMKCWGGTVRFANRKFNFPGVRERVEGSAHRRLRRRRREGCVPSWVAPGQGAEQLVLRDRTDPRHAGRGRLRLPADTLRRLPRSSQSNAGRKSSKGLIMGNNDWELLS